MWAETGTIAEASAPGYLSARYAQALREFGVPQRLPLCGGWLLEREIAGARAHDAMGCYPLFFCRDWRLLAADLDELKEQLVSVALVADPFGEYDAALLQTAFDFARPFKQHFIADLRRDPEEFISRNHRYKALRSLRDARVERCDEPSRYVDEWSGFYDTLIARHKLGGIKAFSLQSFRSQLALPELVMFRYLTGGVAVGAQLWFVQGEYAYNHLMAMDEAGYEMRAAYGLCYEALRQFRKGAAGPVRLVDLGGGAGWGEAGEGLAQFKRGWATETRPAYFCGRILQPERYAELSEPRNKITGNYFPAYRYGEFH